MNSRHAVISDSQWELRTPFMPDSTDKAGRPFNDHSLMSEGIFYYYMAGIPWRDSPEHFGYWKLARKRYRHLFQEAFGVGPV